MYTGCIYVDFSKAFETIDHKILLEKLKLYGFDTQSLALMRNYITTRTQVTTVNGNTSSSRNVECGTAQGSILGPLIYIIYVNDVLNVLDCENDIFLYADDMLIISRDKNVDQMIVALQGKMDNIFSWCQSNRLTKNQGKTKYMVISSMDVKLSCGISIGDQTIRRVKQYEYLGMIIEERLNMDKQIECIYKKANKKLCIMSRIRIVITDKTASKIYKTMIRPHLEYVDFIIDSGSKKLVSKMDRLQKRALRRIENSINSENRKSYTELEKLYGIENLQIRQQRSLLMHNIH